MWKSTQRIKSSLLRDNVLHCRVSIVTLILVNSFKIQMTTNEKTQLLKAPEGLSSVLRTNMIEKQTILEDCPLTPTSCYVLYT